MSGRDHFEEDRGQLDVTTLGYEVKDVVAGLISAHAAQRIVLQLQVHLVDKASPHQLDHLLLLALRHLLREGSLLLVVEDCESAGVYFRVGVAGNESFLDIPKAGKLAVEEGLPALGKGHAEQVLAVRVDFMLHVIDELISDSPFALSYCILPVLLEAIALQDAPLQHTFLKGLLGVLGQPVPPVIQSQDVSIDVIAGLKHPLHFLLVYLEQSFSTDRFLRFRVVVQFDQVGLALQALLTVSLPKVFGANAVNFEVFGIFIDVQTIL